MYLTSFIHRNTLFNIAERWFCNCPEPEDGRSLSEILICDGFVINETLSVFTKRLIEMIHSCPFHHYRIHAKGILRDIIFHDRRNATPRVSELLRRYQDNPDYYYREAPINGVVYLDERNHLLGSSRIKRPKRIAEKAHRRIADWIFKEVSDRARFMASARTLASGIPLDKFITPPEEMLKEFTEAEEFVAQRFRNGSIKFDKKALTIHDVGAVKIVAEMDQIRMLEKTLHEMPDVAIVEREEFTGNYQATNLILQIPWDTASVCQRYRESRAWERYQNRGISSKDLHAGLETFLVDTEPYINIELILSTFSDMVESELGNSIHEERIISQRDNKRYRGYIPLNVEFLVESLFALGFSPKTDIDGVPIKLWGRYLPETLSLYVRHLHNLPERDLID